AAEKAWLWPGWRHVGTMVKLSWQSSATNCPTQNDRTPDPLLESGTRVDPSGEPIFSAPLFPSRRGLWLLCQGQQPVYQRACRWRQGFVGHANGGPLPSVFYRKPIFEGVPGPPTRSGRLTDLAEVSLFHQRLP